ncbi:MAG: hypothetical protein GYB36_11255 [Alphaproteobacteria bacterium]|nr:hypothetical protein [Alphaproteobacteria bacterium]
MPIDAQIRRDPDYLRVVYTGIVSVADVDFLISGMERGDYPANINRLHDFHDATDMVLPDQTATSMSFRRRKTMDEASAGQVRAAVLGANQSIIEAMKVWRATFYGDSTRYFMRICEDEASALDWIGAKAAPPAPVQQ